MMKIFKFMSKNLPAWAIVSVHGSAALLAGWTTYLQWQIGNETGVSFWTMITTIWVGTGIIRLMGDNHAGRN